MYSTGKELGRLIRDGVYPVILYLGDHDPSGINMPRQEPPRPKIAPAGLYKLGAVGGQEEFRWGLEAHARPPERRAEISPGRARGI
jgi:hypothetical protein